MSAMPTFSVVVCTHNRSADTFECLDALYPQIAGGRAELIVVDSASSPAEKNALAACSDRYPALRLIRMDEAGLSLARNAAIAACHGDWVAFLDDDAVPHADWFANLQRVVAGVADNCAALGGRILPLFPGSEPVALRVRQKMYVSINDSTGDRDCTEKFELIAANCCFRRAALVEVGCFPLGLGRVGNQLLSGEDVMLMRSLRNAGWRIRYNSAFCVGHKIVPQRLTDEWLRQRAYWEGVTTVRMAYLLRDPIIWRIAAKVLPSLAVTWLMRSTNRPAQEWDLRFAFNRGLLAEMFWHGPKRRLPQFVKPPIAPETSLTTNPQNIDQAS